jgi:hypothetical protein
MQNAVNKTISFTLLFCLSATISFAQQKKLSDTEIVRYRQDAAEITYSLIDKTKKISEQDIYLDKETLESAYNALIAIHNSDLPAAKTLTQTYQFHSANLDNLNTFVLMLEQENPILAHARTTKSFYGINKKLDDILQPLGFKPLSIVGLDNTKSGILIQSPTFYNIPAIMDKVYIDTRIGSIQQQLPYGDGNKIDAKKDDNKWTITFRMRFKNCVNKCEAEHFWTFVVENNEVKFINEGGDNIPAYFNKQK